MFDSSIGSATTQQVLQPLLSSAETSQGQVPATDNDRDDVSNVTTTANVSNSADVTESIGQNINVYA